MEEEHPSSKPEPISYQATEEPRSKPRPDDQLEPKEQPSMICGFTLTELANVTLQVAGIIIGAVFGIWAVKSYESANIANRLAEKANEQSSNANLLAVINLCLSDQLRNFTDCPVMLQQPLLSSIVQAVFPAITQLRSTSTPSSTINRVSPNSTQTTTPMTTTTTTLIFPDSGRVPLEPLPDSTQSSKTLPFGAIVGIVAGAVVTVAIFCLLMIRYRRAKRSRS